MEKRMMVVKIEGGWTSIVHLLCGPHSPFDEIEYGERVKGSVIHASHLVYGQLSSPSITPAGEHTVTVVGNKWSLLVLRELFNGVRRFDDMHRHLGVSDAVTNARKRLPAGESATHCEDCGEPIPERRRQVLAGVKTCVDCQAERDGRVVHSTINRRGSKDSQLR